MDSIATYGWIMYQDACNREVLGRLPDFEELFARAVLPELAAVVEKVDKTHESSIYS